MELKVAFVDKVARDAEFQSHLYGIERTASRHQERRKGAFQSHLYGIESCVFILFLFHLLVSIAPLWN